MIQDVELRVAAGSALGVIGPSASGKSSLARALVGVWAPARGKIRLDGVDLAHWPPQRLGRHVGYLPQDVELFAGTVAENIARFYIEIKNEKPENEQLQRDEDDVNDDLREDRAKDY